MSEHINRLKNHSSLTPIKFKRIASAWTQYFNVTFKDVALSEDELRNIKRSFYAAYVVAIETAIKIAGNYNEETSFKQIEDINQEFLEFIKES